MCWPYRAERTIEDRIKDVNNERHETSGRDNGYDDSEQFAAGFCGKLLI